VAWMRIMTVLKLISLASRSLIDITSMGAGDGSIAWLQPRGLPKVGPHSAGSTSGPACYGRGGTKPTASDVCTLLGYFDQENFWGGRLRLDLGCAEEAMANLAANRARNFRGQLN